MPTAARVWISARLGVDADRLIGLYKPRHANENPEQLIGVMASSRIAPTSKPVLLYLLQDKIAVGADLIGARSLRGGGFPC